MGYELFYYELIDHRAKVEELFEVVKDLERKKYEIIVKLNLEIFQVCENWSDDIHTPVFKKYFIDGENKRLIPLFLDTHIDVVEAWTPAPMTQVTTAL